MKWFESLNIWWGCVGFSDHQFPFGSFPNIHTLVIVNEDYPPTPIPLMVPGFVNQLAQLEAVKGHYVLTIAEHTMREEEQVIGILKKVNKGLEVLRLPKAILSGDEVS